MDMAMSLRKGPKVGEGGRVVLSSREREVLGLALSGMTAAAMAESLFVTEATIRSHLARIYGKFGVHNRVELVLACAGPAESGDRGSDRRGPGGSPFPSRGRLSARRRLVAIAAAAGMMLVIAFALFSAADSAGAMKLGDIAAAIDQGNVVRLEFNGDRLAATTRNGQVLTSKPITSEQFAKLNTHRVAGEVSASGSGTTAFTRLGMLATAVMPAVVVALLVFAAIRVGRIRIERPPRGTSPPAPTPSGRLPVGP